MFLCCHEVVHVAILDFQSTPKLKKFAKYIITFNQYHVILLLALYFFFFANWFHFLLMNDENMPTMIAEYMYIKYDIV